MMAGFAPANRRSALDYEPVMVRRIANREGSRREDESSHSGTDIIVAQIGLVVRF